LSTFKTPKEFLTIIKDALTGEFHLHFSTISLFLTCHCSSSRSL
jgi:hypothetical protein